MNDRQYYNVSGRLVQGNVFEPQTKDMQGRPMTDMKGNPKVQYFIGVAVDKNAPDFPAAWQGITQTAQADFPNGETGRQDFAWKVIDGDAPEHAQKTGFPGHWVFRFTSGFPFQPVAKDAARPITDPDEIKRGYYIRVFFTVAGNKNQQKPGVYLNASVVELLGFGEEITSGPKASEIIQGAGSAHIPAGAQSTPLPGAPGGQQAPPAPGAPGGQQAPPAPGVPGGQQAPPAPGGIQPDPSILNPGGQQ